LIGTILALAVLIILVEQFETSRTTVWSRLASAGAITSIALAVMSHYDRYRELALASFHEFESRLNWSVAGAEMKRVLTEIVGRAGLN
jgi:hypothetical protein